MSAMTNWVRRASLFMCLPLLALALSACGGGSSGGDTNGGDTASPVNLLGAVVKGALANATLNAYPLLVNGSVSIGSIAIDSGTTSAQAAIQGLEIPAGTALPIIIEFTANDSTIDLSTGKPPVLSVMRTVVTQAMVDSGARIYLTPLTTMAIDYALARTNSEGPQTIARFLLNLDLASTHIGSTLGFGIGSDLDIFTTPPLLDEGADTDEKRLQSARYRAAIEALSAIIYQMSELLPGSGTDQILRELAEDLLDGELDGGGDSARQALITALLSQDPATLLIPGSSFTVGQIFEVLNSEAEQIGSGNTASGDISSYLSFATIRVDRDGDGIPNIDDPSPDGGAATYSIGGSVTGLMGSGLVLGINGGNELSLNASGNFSFTTPLADGSAYTVSVKNHPASQACTLSNASGVVSGANVTDVTVICASNVYTVGGSVSGLASSGLVLQNNGGDDLPLYADGSFTFGTAQESGDSFSATILSQPVNQHCTLEGANGTVNAAHVTTITVTCTSFFSIGGSVSGLHGAGLVMQNNGGDALAISADGPFTFTSPLLDGTPYSVSIQTQPSKQICLLSNASGTVSGAAVKDVAIACQDTYTIDASGADSLGANGGGAGGTIDLYKEGSLGNVEILTIGHASASVTVAPGTPYLGANPLVVVGDTRAVVPLEGITDPATQVSDGQYYLNAANQLMYRVASGNYVEADPGTLYLLASDYELYTYAGSLHNPGAEHTGIEIQSGATLTLALNSGEAATLILFDDLVNDGTLTVEDFSATTRGSVDLLVHNYYGRGTITTAGTSSTPHAGSIIVWADIGFTNSGTLNAHGADVSSGNGGNGALVEIDAIDLLNEGAIDVSGGNGAANGSGGGVVDELIHLYADVVVNAGALSASGGDGGIGGGPGADIVLLSSRGAIYNTASINATGGAGTASGAPGGAGGHLDMTVNGGDLVSNETLNLSGGDGVAGGGQGGDVTLFLSGDATDPSGDILVSGDISVAGGVTGSSGVGGSAGVVLIQSSSDGSADNERLALLGFTDLYLDGGDSSQSGQAGGQGGRVSIESATDAGFNPGGGIVNQARISALGGDALASGGFGGRGGSYEVTSSDINSASGQTVSNSAMADVSGGQNNNTQVAGHAAGGWIWLDGYNGVTNTALLRADGGRDIGGGFGGTALGNVTSIALGTLTGKGTLDNRGVLSANGGSGDLAGGDGGQILLAGYRTLNSANASAVGGDADPATSATTGGDGGYIGLGSDTSSGQSTDNSATLDVAGGAGNTPGTTGCQEIDGVGSGNCSP